MDGEHGGVLPLHPLLSLLTHLTHAQKSHTPHSLTLQTHTQIETVLDEATAEAAKLAVSHLVSTIDVRFKIGRPVPLHTSLEVGAWVEKVAGARVTVAGAIREGGGGGRELASCVAVLADLAALRRAGV